MATCPVPAAERIDGASRLPVSRFMLDQEFDHSHHGRRPAATTTRGEVESRETPPADIVFAERNARVHRLFVELG